jgi:hypothetical protein
MNSCKHARRIIHEAGILILTIPKRKGAGNTFLGAFNYCGPGPILAL